MSIQLKKIVLCTALATCATQLHAAGFAVAEHSATGQGRAFAGEAAMGDNAAVIARNPAAMSLFDRASFAGQFTSILPKLDLDAQSPTGSQQTVENIAPLQFVPGLYYVHPVNNKFALGLGFFSDYGVTSEYPENFGAGPAAGKTSLVTLNLNPSFSYKMDEYVTVGLGFSLLYGDATLSRYYGDEDSNPRKELMQLAGDSWGGGWNIGILYQPNKNNRFGLSYRAQSTLNFEGEFTDHTGQLTNAASGIVNAELEAVLPAVLEFSGFHQMKPKIALHYSLLWTDWGKFKELKATSSQCVQGSICFAKEESYHNTLRYAVGATYDVDAKWQVRGGLAYDPHAGEPTMSIPDMDRIWYSLGGSYAYNTHLSFDLGMSLIQGRHESFTEDAAIYPASAGDYTLKTSGYVVLAALQMNYKF